MNMERQTKLLILISIFVAVLAFISLTSAKIATVFGITFSISVFFYAITFFCTDVISECWGKEMARKVVWMGFLAAVLMVVFTLIAIALPPADFWVEQQEFFASFFGLVPRIVLGGLIAYLASQMHDVWAFHFWRKKTANKHLWLRNNASTIVSQFIDTVIFVSIAFYGTVPISIFFSLLWGQYLIKLVIAAIDTPLVYAARRWIGVPQEIIDRHR